MTAPIDDPWSVLGVTPDVTPDELRARYVALVKAHPPDRDPATFERLRDAYAKASDVDARARERVFGPEPLADLAELVRILARDRRPAGAAAWLDVLAQPRKGR